MQESELCPAGTGQPSHEPCGAPQGASSDTWRPGFARRPDNHQETLALAGTVAGTGLDKFELAQAVRGLEEVPAGEKLVLLEYLDAVPAERLATGAAFGWISMAMLAARLGYSVAQVRRLRAGLEARGLAYRHYDNRNSQAAEAGFDLRPLIGRAEAGLAARQARMEAVRERRIHDRTCPTLGNSEEHARARIDARHIQTPQIARSDSVPGPGKPDPAAPPGANASASTADSPRQRDMPTKPVRANDTAPLLPAGARGSDRASPAPAVGADAARQALLEAWQLSPRWREVVRFADVSSLALRALYAATERALPQLLPDEDPGHSRNSHMTWRWAVERHGWRAIPMLVVALEDPSVVKRPNFFGWLTDRQRGEVDLRPNLERIRLHREEERLSEQGRALAPIGAAQRAELRAAGVDAAELPTPAEATAGPAAEPWERILALLVGRIEKARFRAWIKPLVPAGLEGETLVLEAPVRAVADGARQRYADDILRAARNAGLAIRKVTIAARRQ